MKTEKILHSLVLVGGVGCAARELENLAEESGETAEQLKSRLARASNATLERAPLLRPSSARRLANLRALVAEFAGRAIGCAGVALFLDCSLSAARNYVAELLDAGVIASHPERQAAGCVDRTLYRQAADPLKVDQFLGALTRTHGADGMAARRGAAEPGSSADPERIHRLWRDADFSFGAGRSPARRDPLVAALFGAAGRS